LPREVVSTQPAGGAEHVKGGYVVISHLGAITVPDLAGQPCQQACDQLRQSGVLDCVSAPQGVAPVAGRSRSVLTQDPPPSAAWQATGSTPAPRRTGAGLTRSSARRPPAQALPSWALPSASRR
jgi:beta-lactam-binding protein with PASTA domain